MSQSYESVLKGIAGHEEAIRRNEARLAADPQGYKSSLKSFAILGYVLYGLILLSSVACAFASLWLFMNWGVNKLSVYFGVFTLVYLYATLAALFLRFQPHPLSIEVTPQKAPELWLAVNRLSEVMHAPKIDKIFIDFDMNASALQWPRFGLFGRAQNILTIGAPLMMAMDEKTLRSVIAHEFGHFAGEHGRQSGFVYRSAQLFGNLYGTLAQSNNVANFLVRSILNWYYPKLEQMSLPVSRVNEYEADRAAVNAVGIESFRTVMVRLPAIVAWYGKYVQDKAITSLPDAPMAWMIDALRNQIPPTIFEAELLEAAKQTTDLESTHPSLNDRMASQGLPRAAAEDIPDLATKFNQKIERTAYDDLLNDNVRQALKELVEPILLIAQTEYKAKSPSGPTASIESLHQQDAGEIPPKTWFAKPGQTPLQQFWDLSASRLDLGEASFARSVKEFAEANKADTLLTMLCGQTLMDIDRLAAIELLHKIHMSPTYSLIVNQLLVGLLHEEGDTAQAAHHFEIHQTVEQWLNTHAANLKQASAYEIHPPLLSASQIEQIREAVAGEPTITSAYLCSLRKKKKLSLKYDGDVPVLFFDCLSSTASKWRWTGSVSGQSDEVGARLVSDISGVVLPLPLAGDMVKWYGRLQKPNDALKIK